MLVETFNITWGLCLFQASLFTRGRWISELAVQYRGERERNETYLGFYFELNPDFMTFVTGDCNLHLNVVTSEYNEELTRMIEPFVYEWTSKCRGSVSAEHGIGLIKTQYLKHNKSQHAIDLMRSLKNTMDPKCILNPYKVIPTNAATDGQ